MCACAMSQVPFIVYQNGSNLTQLSGWWSDATRNCADLNFDTDYDNTVIAPTLAALLGTQVPWQAEGGFLYETLALLANQVHMRV